MSDLNEIEINSEKSGLPLEDVAELRELIKPIVIKMHERGWTWFAIVKEADSGKVQTLIE
jgi:hypothetical protein